MAAVHDSPVGANLAPTATEGVDALRSALRLAALHCYREGLRWACDELNVDAGDTPDLAQATLAIDSVTRVHALLNQLGWEPHNDEVEIPADEVAFVAAIARIARTCGCGSLLTVDQASALDSLLDGLPYLDEDAAWQVVFGW